MKGIGQILVYVYAIASLYFLYNAAMGIFVYVANKSLGHHESFLVPGRNLAFGIIIGSVAYAGWKLLNNPASYKSGLFVVFIPVVMMLLMVLYILLIFLTNGGRWN